MTTTDAKKNGHSWSGYATVLIVLVAALLVWPTQRFIEAHTPGAGEDPDILLFSSPKLMKNMALGYDSLLADFYWMRTIQYYGRFDEADKRTIRYKNLYTLLDITTTLDPDLMDAYRTGCFFLAAEEPLGAGKPEEAVKLLDKGLLAHPTAWQLMHDKGFIYYWYTKDFKAAGETWLQGSKFPGAPEWMASLAAVSLSRGGSFQVAFALWEDQYRQSTRENVKKNALDRLSSFQVARDIWGWEMLADKYKEYVGSYPQTLNALAATQGPKPRYSLADPLGMPYRYDPVTGAVFLDPDSEIHYIEVPDIYRDELVAVDFLPQLRP
ncbi:MAG: hypothetical protein LBP68_02945 [Acidobacteriota bacterium]|jgi:tetratricopeptide (TPR) repeat protein|nr:hypothetical protein [Acidobacteriota bacterium]